jgi:hypothetical protein
MVLYACMCVHCSLASPRITWSDPGWRTTHFWGGSITRPDAHRPHLPCPTCLIALLKGHIHLFTSLFRSMRFWPPHNNPSVLQISLKLAPSLWSTEANTTPPELTRAPRTSPHWNFLLLTPLLFLSPTRRATPKAPPSIGALLLPWNTLTPNPLPDLVDATLPRWAPTAISLLGD